MADPNGARWPRLLKELAPTLPGDWDVRGGRGAKALVIRQPVKWTFTWIGLYRVRVADDPNLMVGLVPLVMPFSLNLTHGQRSDSGGGPGTFNLVADDATAEIRRYLLDDALPDLDPWTEPFLAQIAEVSLNRPAAERGSPHFLQAAGWRVVNDTGCPVEPAEEAIAFCHERSAPEEAAWYKALIEAWNHGGRTAGLTYLEQHRNDGLRRLKITS